MCLSHLLYHLCSTWIHSAIKSSKLISCASVGFGSIVAHGQTPFEIHVKPFPLFNYTCLHPGHLFCYKHSHHGHPAQNLCLPKTTLDWLLCPAKLTQKTHTTHNKLECQRQLQACPSAWLPACCAHSARSSKYANKLLITPECNPNTDTKKKTRISTAANSLRICVCVCIPIHNSNFTPQ